MAQFKQQGIAVIAEPESHVIDTDVCDVSVAWQAKHLYYIGHHFIPTQHLIVGIVPIQGHAMRIFTVSQDTLPLCVDQHWPNPLCKTAHSL
jgi:hypothetical protein